MSTFDRLDRPGTRASTFRSSHTGGHCLKVLIQLLRAVCAVKRRGQQTAVALAELSGGWPAPSRRA